MRFKFLYYFLVLVVTNVLLAGIFMAKKAEVYPQLAFHANLVSAPSPFNVKGTWISAKIVKEDFGSYKNREEFTQWIATQWKIGKKNVDIHLLRYGPSKSFQLQKVETPLVILDLGQYVLMYWVILLVINLLVLLTLFIWRNS